jgi:hypothetical protein
MSAGKDTCLIAGGALFWPVVEPPVPALDVLAIMLLLSLTLVMMSACV